MDELDRKLVKALQIDGRASNSQLARIIQVSEGTIRRRLKRLITDGVIRFSVIPDPEALGYETEALIGVQVDPDKFDLVSSHLMELEESSWVSVTTGSFDMFAWVILPSPGDLGDFLKSRVGTIPGVRRTETFVSLSVRKRQQFIIY